MPAILRPSARPAADAQVADRRPDDVVRVALPKGRTEESVRRLLIDAGIAVAVGDRAYRPRLGLDELEAKILKPRAIVEMLAAGSRDVGFAGADWVAEEGAPLVELLDTGLDPVRLVAAAPRELVTDGRLPARRLRVASEYVALARRWADAQGLDAAVVRSYGATEVLPPEDADVIVDNTATGATLRANGLVIVDELMTSTTRLYAAPAALERPRSRDAIDRLVLLLRSVLEARSRVMIELNAPRDRLEAIVAALPCMREPTISTLWGEAGVAVKAAVPRSALARLVPELKARGGTDLVVTPTAQIVP